MKKFTWALLLPLVVIAVLFQAGIPDTPRADAFSVHGSTWAASSANYFVNANFADAAAGSAADQRAALQRGAAEWKCAGQTPFQFTYGGSTAITTVAPTDGTNAVFYTNATSTGALATATWSFQTIMGQQRFIGFDIVFYNGNSSFDFVWALSPNFTQFDIESVAVHEFGHALGMGHSAVSGASMAASVSAGSTAPRTLAADDIAGVQSLYGTQATGTPTLSAVLPQSAWIGGGTRIALTGTNLAGGDPHSITFNGVPATDVTIIDSTHAECTVPASTTPGFCTVSISHAQGTFDLVNGFYYQSLRVVNPLTITGLGTLELWFPSDALKPYQAAPAFGFQAGIPLAQVGDPTDTRVVPINRDALFNSFLADGAHQNVFLSFAGNLDATGRTTLMVDLPLVSALQGVNICFCVVTMGDMAQSGIINFSNAATGNVGP